jgi:hypothetical protein
MTTKPAAQPRKPLSLPPLPAPVYAVNLCRNGFSYFTFVPARRSLRFVFGCRVPLISSEPSVPHLNTPSTPRV